MSDLFEYKGYLGSYRMDPAARCFTGKIEFINDLIMFEGSSFNELEINFQEAVDDYLSLCEEVEKQPDKSFNGNLNVRLGPELHRKAALKAKKDGIKLNQFLCQCVSEKLADNDTVIEHNHVHKHKIDVAIKPDEYHNLFPQNQSGAERPQHPSTSTNRLKLVK
jgi:predicted HicB family RNase H-like nuclease